MVNKPLVVVGFTASPSWLGSLIRKFENADVSHAFLAWLDPDFENWMSLGANNNGVTLQPLSNFAKDKPEFYTLDGPDLWPGIITLLDVINTP